MTELTPLHPPPAPAQMALVANRIDLYSQRLEAAAARRQELEAAAAAAAVRPGRRATGGGRARRRVSLQAAAA